jgi:hypothetical protein
VRSATESETVPNIIAFPGANRLPVDPFTVTRGQAIALLSGRRELVNRLIYYSSESWPEHARWIHIVRAGSVGQDTLIDYQSIKDCYQAKLKFGVEPPPLPGTGYKK